MFSCASDKGVVLKEENEAGADPAQWGEWARAPVRQPGLPRQPRALLPAEPILGSVTRA